MAAPRDWLSNQRRPAPTAESGGTFSTGKRWYPIWPSVGQPPADPPELRAAAPGIAERGFDILFSLSYGVEYSVFLLIITYIVQTRAFAVVTTN